MSNIRNQRQQEFAELYLKSERFGILLLSPRMGKCKVGINIMQEMNSPHTLICYPDEKIRKSWMDDFEKFGFDGSNVRFTTYLSLHKYTSIAFNLVIFDEIQMMSENQINVAKELLLLNSTVLGLTGTLANDTKYNLIQELGLRVLATYPIEQAIEEGVVSNFQINVVRVPLDNKVKLYKGKSEKQKFDAYTYLINKFESEGRDSKFMRLNRMRIIQGSLAKKNMTKSILQKNPEERILVFAGLKKIADDLGIPSFHSETEDETLLHKFASGEGNKLAVIKMGNAGITFTPLSQVIINYFSSNGETLIQQLMRCMSYEYNNPEKTAIITIICSTETVEEKWLKKALKGISEERINWNYKL